MQYIFQLFGDVQRYHDHDGDNNNNNNNKDDNNNDKSVLRVIFCLLAITSDGIQREIRGTVYTYTVKN